ncbi:MAG: formylglycine-generating enzyme family protein [Planctomycetota bacterium]|jgi:formylglycine-generating enzyme required for sulfatase activity
MPRGLRNGFLLRPYAWFARTAGGRMHHVARKKPNAFGLFDMHGNLWEWCGDRYQERGKGPSSCVIRGGGWNFTAEFCRSASRSFDKPDTRNGVLGFRPAKSLIQ